VSGFFGEAAKDEIRALVREELALVLAGYGVKTAALLFTSDALPPRTSRRTFHETCRAGLIDGASKSGRTWSCPAASWVQARGRTAAPPELRLVGGLDVHHLVAESLRASGGGR
jgi:hypothetical protein